MSENPALIVEDWLIARQAAIELAIERDDIAALRKWSVERGGFGKAAIRQKAWSYMLSSTKGRTRDAADLASDNATAGTFGAEESHRRTEKEERDELSSEHDSPHRDEGQVLLDTKRSFVYYPENISPREKLRLQGELNDLIVMVLRRRRGLSYFQGYHDIISILYLTFFPYQNEEPLHHRSASPRRTRSRKTSRTTGSTAGEAKEVRPQSVDRLNHRRATSISPILPRKELQDEKSTSEEVRPWRRTSGRTTTVDDGAVPLPPPPRKQETKQWADLVDSCDALSLLRIRDAMGHTLAPSIGYLRLFKRLLRARDPELSKLVLGVSPTPYFALSWLLTIFSHDLTVLEPTQRIFDYFLARNPAIMIYLGVAIIMLKRKTLLALSDTLGTDPGILHSYLSRLPPLVADNPAGAEEVMTIENVPPAKPSVSGNTYLEPEGPNPLEAVKLSELFGLTDTLWESFPLDHSAIRASDILAPGSVIFTGRDGDNSMPLDEAADFVGTGGFAEEKVVVTPALPETDDEDEEVRRPTRSTRPIKRTAGLLSARQTRMAIAVLAIGASFAFYTSKRDGRPHRLMLDIIGARVASELREVQVYFRKQMSMPAVRSAAGKIEGILQRIGAIRTW